MKKVILTILITLVATVAQADTCTKIYDFAETMMAQRQKGVSIVKMMNTTDNKILKRIIRQAYARPQYAMPENRTDAVERFANDISLQCFAATNR